MKQIVVFHQNGCPACHDYLPRFKRRAVKYRALCNIQTANISTNEKAFHAANKFKVEAVPTTIVFNDSDKVLRRAEGAIADIEIIKLLEFAAK